MRKALSIGIAGAGIGGLAAGVFLARAGHDVTIFDQFDTPSPVGSGLMLQETGLTILGELGLRDAITALGQSVDRLYGLTTPSGRTVLDVRYTAMRKTLHGLAVQRGAVFETLLAAAMEAGARLSTGVCIAVANPKVGTFMDASGAQHGPFDLLIDALGVRSPLSSDPARELPFGALWATLPWPQDGPFDPRALEQRYKSARQMCGVMASGSAQAGGANMATFFWSLRSDAYQAWRDAPLADWKAEALALWPETEGLLAHIKTHDDLTFASYRHRTHSPCFTGCLVHIGDSWHAASPQLGQGANNALLDAYALSLSLHKADGNVERALRHYQKMRKGHVRLFQMMSFLFTPVYQSDSQILPWLRDWLAAPISRIWPGPAFLSAMVSGAVGAPLKKLGLKPGA